MTMTMLLVLVWSTCGPAPSTALKGLDPVSLVEGKQVLGRASREVDHPESPTPRRC